MVRLGPPESCLPLVRVAINISRAPTGAECSDSTARWAASVKSREFTGPRSAVHGPERALQGPTQQASTEVLAASPRPPEGANRAESASRRHASPWLVPGWKRCRVNFHNHVYIGGRRMCALETSDPSHALFHRGVVYWPVVRAHAVPRPQVGCQIRLDADARSSARVNTPSQLGSFIRAIHAIGTLTPCPLSLSWETTPGPAQQGLPLTSTGELSMLPSKPPSSFFSFCDKPALAPRARPSRRRVPRPGATVRFRHLVPRHQPHKTKEELPSAGVLPSHRTLETHPTCRSPEPCRWPASTSRRWYSP